jgi:hypothetical protein
MCEPGGVLIGEVLLEGFERSGAAAVRATGRPLATKGFNIIERKEEESTAAEVPNFTTKHEFPHPVRRDTENYRRLRRSQEPHVPILHDRK